VLYVLADTNSFRLESPFQTNLTGTQFPLSITCQTQAVEILDTERQDAWSPHTVTTLVTFN